MSLSFKDHAHLSIVSQTLKSPLALTLVKFVKLSDAQVTLLCLSQNQNSLTASTMNVFSGDFYRFAVSKTPQEISLQV